LFLAPSLGTIFKESCDELDNLNDIFKTTEGLHSSDNLTSYLKTKPILVALFSAENNS